MNSIDFSVVLPVYNEQDTLGGVLEVFIHTGAREIIVVNDGSLDNSEMVANDFAKRDQRVKVINHPYNLGYGAAKKTGIRAAAGEFILFFDADVYNPTFQMIHSLLSPLVVDPDVDVVMADFDNFGRITNYTAKPLLKLFFPELAFLNQPLSGFSVIRREMLLNLDLDDSIPDGYGMIGLVLDLFLAGARFTQAYIGNIEHDHRPPKEKVDHAEVTCALIIDRAKRSYRITQPSFIMQNEEV